MIFLLVTVASAQADSIALAWDSATDTNSQGYVVYYGTTAGLPTNAIDTGSSTFATITNLQPGQTYYFSVASYNADHVVGPRSGEISYLVPGLVKLVPAANSGEPINLNFPVAPGHWYEVQATSDMEDWEPVCITPVYDFNDWVTFMDFDSPNYPMRFYRVLDHSDY